MRACCFSQRLLHTQPDSPGLVAAQVFGVVDAVVVFVAVYVAAAVVNNAVTVADDSFVVVVVAAVDVVAEVIG